RIQSPACLMEIPRYFRRFGLPRYLFEDFLKEKGPFDFVLIQTMMTYWYPGVKEVIDDIRAIQPAAKIILGGNYVTLCPNHAQRLAADLLVQASNLKPLWKYLAMSPQLNQPALWEAYKQLNVAVSKLSDGCPFNCTYCSVPKVYGRNAPSPSLNCSQNVKLKTSHSTMTPFCSMPKKFSSPSSRKSLDAT
ncbi:MAG: hypothetical protein ACYSUC_12895, partial [Planctomycetota bacterium]